MNNIVKFVLAFIFVYCAVIGTLCYTVGDSYQYIEINMLAHIVFGLIFFVGGGYLVLKYIFV